MGQRPIFFRGDDFLNGHEPFVIFVHFRNMRACFLGQNICALGFGVATLQTPPLPIHERTEKPLDPPAAEEGGSENTTPSLSPALPIVHTPCHNSATHA
jgi:hypothetical protein